MRIALHDRVNRLSTRDQVYAALRAAIVNAELEPRRAGARRAAGRHRRVRHARRRAAPPARRPQRPRDRLDARAPRERPPRPHPRPQPPGARLPRRHGRRAPRARRGDRRRRRRPRRGGDAPPPAHGPVQRAAHPSGPPGVLRGVLMPVAAAPAPDVSDVAALAPETRRELYETMVLSRVFETEAERQYKAARIGGYCHLSSGQEATTVGVVHALQLDDLLVTGYRSHGFALARGTSPEAVMAELFGREDGCAHGRGGSMHILDVDRGYYGGWGIVAGQLPVATGLALALVRQAKPQAVVCELGDGAVNM